MKRFALLPAVAGAVLLAGLTVSAADIRALGVGGLLMEIGSRPQPRLGGNDE